MTEDIASKEPSPPSAIGKQVQLISVCLDNSLLKRLQISMEDNVPLNESLDITIFIAFILHAFKE